jgi:cell division septation protein DedD
LEAAEKMIIQLAAMLMDLRWVGDIIYSGDYEDKDLQFRMSLLQTASQLAGGNAVVQAIIDREVVKMITPPEETAAYLALIGQSVAEPQTNTTDWMNTAGAQDMVMKEKASDQIFDSTIQDKGVTTNDPLARQLVMLGVGR